MPRLPRLNLPDIPQHVVQRGNNRQDCFFSVQDYKVYLDKLKIYSAKYKVRVHSFVLMTNHVHLLLTPSEGDGVSRLMQALGRYYVRYVNEKEGRTGTLWEGRYKSCIIDSERYFLTVSRYIELNPVRTQMVSHPKKYPWSSYQSNAVGKPIELITEHDCYLSLGKTADVRQTAYRELFRHQIKKHTLIEIRDGINKAWVLGGNRFKEQVEKQSGRRASPLPRGGDRKSAKFRENG
ncbi:MAG: transposase [Thiohalomonadales bacterium]